MTNKILCTGYPRCGRSECPHAKSHTPKPLWTRETQDGYRTRLTNCATTASPCSRIWSPMTNEPLVCMCMSVAGKFLCTGFPACGFSDCPHATAHEPYTFGGSDGDGVTCETEGPCARWQQQPGIGPKRSRCRCIPIEEAR